MTKAAAPEKVSNDISDVIVRKMKAIRQLKSLIDAKRQVKAAHIARNHRVDNGIVSKLEKADFIRKHSRGVYVWNGGDISKDDNLIAMIDLVYPRIDRDGGTSPTRQRTYSPRRSSAVAPSRPNFGMTDFEILAYDITSQVDDVVIMKVIARKRPAAVTVLIPEVAASNGSVPASTGF